MEDVNKVIANSKNHYIVLSNQVSDPSVWVLKIYKKILFFKKKVFSYWFNNEKQATEYANEYLKLNPAT